jgi:predicted acyltransferase
MDEPSGNAVPQRLVSLDAYRGFVMLAMASGGLGLTQVADHFPDHQVWQGLDFQLDHVPWCGGSFWDLIQPSFMFIVGVAMPFSFAARRAQGHSWSGLFGHTVKRSVILVLLGIFLSSAWSKQTNFTFVNVLTQIGLGYTFVFLLLDRSPKVQLTAALAILAVYWLLFATYPLTTDPYERMKHGVSLAWPSMQGFAAHWEKNTNFAAAFDRWFLNLFPRPDGKPFVFNEGGYATLNFVPSIATMLFGVLAGELLRSSSSKRAKLQSLLIVGALGIALGALLDTTICPSVKRIWTPSWVILSTGWTCWLLAGFYGLIDVAGFRRWAFPLVVVGANSIAMYVMAQLLKPFVVNTLKIHLGWIWTAFIRSAGGDQLIYRLFGTHPEPQLFQGLYGPIEQSASVLFVLWLVCLWMYRERIFIKI